jgi:hypothetical protein
MGLKLLPGWRHCTLVKLFYYIGNSTFPLLFGTNRFADVSKSLEISSRMVNSLPCVLTPQTTKVLFRPW